MTAEGKNLTYGQFWETDRRPFGREGGVGRSKRGFVLNLNRKNVWGRPDLFFEEGCSPEQSVR